MSSVGPSVVAQEDLQTIRDAIRATDDRVLHDWVAVAIWGDREGDVTVLGESSPLQLKGYLHSGLWASIHDAQKPLAPAEKQSISDATDVRTFPGGRMDIVRVGGMAIGRGKFEPGWRWTESMAPIVGTDLCPLTHIGLMLAGTMLIELSDGSQMRVRSGEAFAIPANHDAWTVGDEACHVIEILAADDFALPWREVHR
ncbi:MAG: cupin domain-containing protein [Actinomycetota bacterium]